MKNAREKTGHRSARKVDPRVTLEEFSRRSMRRKAVTLKESAAEAKRAERGAR
jgi:hypothetical protein